MEDIATCLGQMESGQRGRQRKRKKQVLNETNVNNIEKYWLKPECTLKYCWTHGSCGHTGEQCRTRYHAQGHVANAMLDNRQGGSTKNMVKHSQLSIYT